MSFMPPLSLSPGVPWCRLKIQTRVLRPLGPVALNLVALNLVASSLVASKPVLCQDFAPASP